MMNYRTILREQLQRRQAANPRYSLRSFAAKLELSPSKLSEVLAGKKRLSTDRAQILAEKLNLSGGEKDLFVLSAQIESTARGGAKADLERQLRALNEQMAAQKTEQHNAWYFGAVQALEEAGIDPRPLAQAMGLTDLQVENAQRFQRRIRRYYPERKSVSFEPTSVLQKIEEESFAQRARLETEFLMLGEDSLREFEEKLARLVKSYKAKARAVAGRPEDLRMIYFGCVSNLIRN